MASGNHSTITTFFLLGLSADLHIQAVLFVLFLEIHFLTIMGNFMMVLVIRADSHLHTPMYFFLSHLFFLDLCLSSVIVPKMLKDLLSETKTISVKGCLVQGFFVFITVGTEACLLSVMVYDRYATICHFLFYAQMMKKQLCVQLVWGSWGLGALSTFINTLLAANLHFCENHTISCYSCEVPSLLSLSCSDVSTNLIVLLCSSLMHGFGTLLPTVSSYACVVSTILSISSTAGRSKVFSTCSTHLTAVSFFFGSGFLCYLMPTSGSPLELIFSVQYGVVTPMVNPLVYSLEKGGEGSCEKNTGKVLAMFQTKK